MSGIYGSSKEDRYFEDRLLRYLDQDLEISGCFFVEDYQFSVGEVNYSFDVRVYVRNGEIEDIEVLASATWDDNIQDWVEFEYSSNSEIFDRNKLLSYLFDGRIS